MTCGRVLHLAKFQNPARPGLKNICNNSARPGPDLRICILCQPGPARVYNIKTRARPGPGSHFIK